MIKIKFNQEWIFNEGGGSALAALTGKGTDESRTVTLPHDASIEKTRNPQEANGSGNGFFREENYHYTKNFKLEAEDENKNVWLEFEGVYQNAFVYINGAFAGKCPYGYGNFYIDATPYVRFDADNTIKVIVKNGVPSGRWYTGGGIYRDVNLMIADRLHFIPDGVQLAAVEAEEDQAVIRAQSTIEYTGTGVRDIFLVMQLLDVQGKVVAEDVMPITAMEHTKQTYSQKLYVSEPNRWDENNPYLYQYRAEIREKNAVLDSEEGAFGIRRLQLDRAHGLRVNGREVKLRGGCIHHDNGITGTAEFPYAAEARVRRLKEAGYNAIRSSHYPMSRQLLAACDKLGMYVMDEFSDVWTTTKVDFDYGTHMSDWWEHDVTNLVRKDYNHPCVLMYSIGNEIPETGNKFDAQWGKKLADKIRSLDDSRYVTNSLNLMLSIMDRMGEVIAEIQAQASTAQISMATQAQEQIQEQPQPDNEKKEINSMMSSMGNMMDMLIGSENAGKATEEAFAQVDIAGYNYAACRYEKDAISYPNRILVGSETYPQDLDKNWELVNKHPWLIGDFSWTAWDYLGEAGIGKITYGEKMGMSFYAPYPYKAAYCGDINLIGDRRPISYWREIIWGFRKAPYLSVQPPQYHDVEHNMTSWSLTNAVRSWNFAGYEEKPVTVEVYTDAEEAVLYCNGKLIEQKQVGTEKKARVLFETVYTPGTLEVVVYTDGEETGRDRIVTADADVRIAAHVDRTQIPADQSDIGYVEISMTDKNGILNPEAVQMVHISIDGPGKIVGFGSADPGSEENYFDMSAKPYEGRLRAAVRGTGETGIITIILTGEGIGESKVQMEAV